MNQKIKITIFAFWMMSSLGIEATNQNSSPVYTPFQTQNYPTSQGPLRSPSEDLPNDNKGGGAFVGGNTGNNFGGPSEELPNDNKGGGGWVGMPVCDALRFLILLAIGYGIHLRNRTKRFRLFNRK